MSLPSTSRALTLSAVLLGVLASSSAAQFSYGAGCPGSRGTPSLDYSGSPALGQKYSINLSNAPGNTPVVLLFGATSAALPLDALGAPGCQLLVPATSPGLALATDPRGMATVTLVVPNSASLINATMYNQWAVVDPRTNNLGITTSNGGRVVIGGPPPLLRDHDTLDIRVEPGPGVNLQWLSTVSPNFVKVPQMAASFATKTDDIEVAITFSAEAYTSASTSRMFVRALIDGVAAAPDDIVFTEGSFRGARSFTFTGIVDAGIHTVEIQWRRDPTGPQRAVAYMRTRSLEIRRAPTAQRDGTLTIQTPASGKNLTTTEQVWKSIAGAQSSFYSPANATVTVGFSAETYVSVAGSRMFVRALVDGAPLSPSDVVFSSAPSLQARTMTFGTTGLAEGQHTAEIQWLVDADATATMGDRTLVVSAFPNSIGRSHRFVAAPSGPLVVTNSNLYVPVPDLSALVPFQRGDEMSVRVSGEVLADPGTELWVRARIGNSYSSEQVALATATASAGVQSFVFDKKGLCSQTSLVGVQIEWRVTSGQAQFGDRTMTLVIEPRAIPDLAEAPPIGDGNRGVEPAIGKRKLLTLLWDPSRPAPHTAPPAADVVDALFGPHGVSDYYEVNSGGRFTLENEGVLGWFASQKPWQHYWNAHPGCGQPGNDGFTGGHQEKWVEAIVAADPQVDFASYDTDGDGTLQPAELAILIVIPQGTEAGFTRTLAPYCSGAPFTVDGVIIPAISEWYTNFPARFSTAAHELGHLITGLGDLYINNFNSNTEPGSLSLMADNFANTAHIDPMNKLALGWLNPCVVESNGWIRIDDVKHSGQVWILPRRGSCEQEFFLLENRQSSGGDPLYDEMLGLSNSGIVVWHIVLDPAQAANAPVCMGQVAWTNNVTGNGRQMLRVVRPSITFSSNGTWDAADYDLNSFGLVCPGAGSSAVNVLRWADGTPSGYQILSWPAPAPSMNVFVVTP